MLTFACNCLRIVTIQVSRKDPLLSPTFRVREIISWQMPRFKRRPHLFGMSRYIVYFKPKFDVVPVRLQFHLERHNSMSQFFAKHNIKIDR